MGVPLQPVTRIRLYAPISEEHTEPAAKDRASGSGVQELVPLNFRGDAASSVRRGFHPHDLPLTPDVDVVSPGSLLWKRNHKIDGGAHFKLRFGQKIQAAVAHVPRLRAKLRPARFPRQYAHRQRHIETAGFPAFGSIAHGTPRALRNLPNAIIGPRKLQFEFGTI